MRCGRQEKQRGFGVSYRHGKIDGNQNEIRQFCHDCGASTFSIADAGDGKPDLIVWYRGRYRLWETKSKNGILTPRQEKFHREWPGPIEIVKTKEDAFNALFGKHNKIGCLDCSNFMSVCEHKFKFESVDCKRFKLCVK